MKTKFFILAVTVLAFTACKKEAESKESTEQKPATQDFFSVELDASAETADDFALYYTEDNTNVFKDTEAIWAGISGGNELKKVTFNLPEEVLPTNIRLDLGIKKDRKSFTIHNVKIVYLDKTLEFKGSEFLNYFIANKVVTATPNPANGTTVFVHDNNSAEGSYYYPRQELIDAIAAMIK